MANNILVPQDDGNNAIVATIETGGVHTLQVTTAAPNSSIRFMQANGQVLLLATVLAGGVHTVCVTV